MAHIELTFKISNIEEGEMLVALLSELQFDGFQEDDGYLKAYIKEINFQYSEFNNLVEYKGIKYSKSIIKDENWNADWESSFEPVSVFHPTNESLFAFVRADFHSSNPNAAYDLLITPKMSFGTGHHATTLQMMQQMSGIEFTNKSVIDFGTGTGLLSILAEKMGASAILAIDNDDWSINNAKENIAANNCSKIEVLKAETCKYSTDKADILLANINLNVIIENLDNILSSCKHPVKMLFSGILTVDETKILPILAARGINILNVASNNNWLVIIGEI